MASESESRAGSGRPRTWLYMIVSLLVVGGFLVWLGMAGEPSSVAISEEEAAEVEAESEAAGEGVTVISKDTLAENKAAFEGRRIQVAQVEATSSLGPGIFWGELGDRSSQVPILVRLDSTAAEGFEMRPEALYTVTGELQRMTDSVATAWGEQGEFAGEGEQMQATFTDYFIQASRIRPSRREGSGGGNGGGAGASGSSG